MTPSPDMEPEELPPTYFQVLFYEYTIERFPAHQAWASLLIIIASLLICLAFLYGSIRFRRTKHSITSTPTVTESVAILSPIEHVYQDDKGRKLSNASSLFSLASSSSTHLSRPPHRNSNNIDVCALITLSWAIVTVDQIAELAVFSLHQTSCPTFVCFDGDPTMTNECPLMYPAFLLATLAQPVGMCLFVLATMIQFVRVYSVLSRARYLALLFGSVLAISATAIRLAVLAVHHLMPLWLYRGRLTPVDQLPGIDGNDEEELEEPSFVGPQDTLVNIISLGSFWSFPIAVCVYTACALMAVGLGMQFIASVRNQVAQTLHSPGLDNQVAGTGRGQRSKMSATAATGRDAKCVRTTVMLMAAVVGCLGSFFLALRDDIVESDQMGLSLVNLMFRIIMALLSLAMVEVHELVVLGNQSDENHV